MGKVEEKERLRIEQQQQQSNNTHCDWVEVTLLDMRI